MISSDNKNIKYTAICLMLVIILVTLVSCNNSIGLETATESTSKQYGTEDQGTNQSGDHMDHKSVEEVFYQTVTQLENTEYSWLVEGLAKYAEYRLASSQGASIYELTNKYEAKDTEIRNLEDYLLKDSLATASFILWIEKNLDDTIGDKLLSSLQVGNFSQDSWYEFTGNTTTVLWDMYCGRLESEAKAKESYIYFTDAGNQNEINLTFAGDINFDENWSTMEFFNTQENGSFDVLSKELIDKMVSADLMMLNNEFTYSDRGAPLKNKAYTFRAKPERVNILHDWGVDLVALANNHVFDYGPESFYDTLETLDEVKINYVGAGKNIDEAMQAIYYIINGKKIAFVSATRAEKYILTPEAKKQEPGVLRTYDSALFLECIKEAKKNSDVVIAYVHWGTEYSPYADEHQKTLGKEYIDAGADIVLGGHSHCLQGIEFYNGKPIVYSLSDFWFNARTTDTTLLRIKISSDSAEHNVTVEYLPCIQTGVRTSLVLDENEKQRILNHIEKISYNVSIDEDGVARPLQ